MGNIYKIAMFYECVAIVTVQRLHGLFLFLLSRWKSQKKDTSLDTPVHYQPVVGSSTGERIYPRHIRVKWSKGSIVVKG